ncbi:signal peptidase I [Candidatus Saccharibacteria bacterium]|nr:signal peptidase I [Candidatus Saccharibacteria bacterium]
MDPNQRDNQLSPAPGPAPQQQPVGSNEPPASSHPMTGPVSKIYPDLGSLNGSAAASAAPSGSDNSPSANHRSKPRRREGWKSVFSTVLLFILAPVIALSITAFAFQSYQVDGQSMETTLQNGDRLIVNKSPRTLSRITHHAYVPKRGSIIIFNQAGLFDSGGNQEKQLIKRVIGLPGERVVVSDGQVTVYNDEHPNGYNPDKTGQYSITASTTPGNVDVILRPGEIFVCGDNRTNSEDSRFFGPVSLDQVVGKLLYRVMPINKAHKF